MSTNGWPSRLMRNLFVVTAAPSKAIHWLRKMVSVRRDTGRPDWDEPWAAAAGLRSVSSTSAEFWFTRSRT